MGRRTCAKADLYVSPCPLGSSVVPQRQPPARGMAKGSMGAHGKAKAVAKHNVCTHLLLLLLVMPWALIPGVGRLGDLGI